MTVLLTNLIVRIGGTDYGKRGLGRVTKVRVSPTGAGLIGTATISLIGPGNLYAFPDKTPVEIWELSLDGLTVIRRLFGGFTSARSTARLAKGGQAGGTKTFELVCQDYNLELRRLVLRADGDDVVISAGSFATQVAAACELAQSSLGGSPLGGYPTLVIDASSEVSISPGPDLDDSANFKGRSLDFMLKSICAAARDANPALRPRFYLGLPGSTEIAVGSFSFGPPTLYVYDAATVLQPVAYFSDSNRGHAVPHTSPTKFYAAMRDFSRDEDGSALVNWRQGAYGGIVLDPTVDVSASVSTYPNPFAADGLWKEELLTLDSTGDEDDAQAALNNGVTATMYPRESFNITTDLWVMPGYTVGIENTLEGLDPDPANDPEERAWYTVSSAEATYEPGKPAWVTLSLKDRPLLLGETPDDDTGYPPIEFDRVPPAAPGSFALSSNVYNPSTGLSELTFTWDASTAADLSQYELRLVYPDNGSGQTYLQRTENTSVTLTMRPDTSFNARVQAIDYSGNKSADSNIVSDSAAPPITSELYNGAFEIAAAGDVHRAQGWTASGTAANNRRTHGNNEADGALEGVYCWTFDSTAGSACRVTSTRMYVEAGADYEANLWSHLYSGAPGNWLTSKLLFYDSSDAYMSGQDAVCADKALAYGGGSPTKSIILTAPSGAHSCAIVIQIDSTSGGVACSVDAVTVRKLAVASARAGALSSANAQKVADLTVPTSGTVALRDGNSAAGRLAYWGDANTLSGYGNLFWDATNLRLGIGTNTPAAFLNIVSIRPSAVSSGSGTNATSALIVTGAAGGNTTDTGTATGGNSAGISLAANAGGQALNAATAATGGAGGAFTMTGAPGGAQSVAGTGTNTGGAGGAFTMNAGAGGAATAASSGANTGGTGGAVTITGGAGGAGNTGTGQNTSGAGGAITVAGGAGGIVSGSGGSGYTPGTGGAATFRSGNGGMNQQTGSPANTGGTGGATSFTSGDGGLARNSTSSNSGGVGGASTFASGTGGAANIGSTSVNVGGAGGKTTIRGGNGGAAANGTTSNSGGAGGDLELQGGIGGTGNTAAGAGGAIILSTGATTTRSTRLTITKDGNVVQGTAALATGATDGFLYVETCAGTPSGTPTAFTGRVPLIIDSTNSKLYAYIGGAWKQVTLT